MSLQSFTFACIKPGIWSPMAKSGDLICIRVDRPAVNNTPSSSVSFLFLFRLLSHFISFSSPTLSAHRLYSVRCTVLSSFVFSGPVLITFWGKGHEFHFSMTILVSSSPSLSSPLKYREPLLVSLILPTL